MKYLVTTRLEALERQSSNCQVIMVDGTVPGFQPKPEDYHFDHHRPGGADIQIDEIMAGDINPNGLIVTTMVDADACVAAAYIQLPSLSEENLAKLRAIAYDCDHLSVPSDLERYSDFAAQAVAAMKADSESLLEELKLPKNRKEWSVEQREKFTSLAFKKNTQALIDACLGKRKFPGECGEAAEYWKKVEQDTELLLNENRVTFYKETLFIDYKGLQGRYIDPRCALKAYRWIYDNYGHEAQTPITLAQREMFINNEFKGYSYTLGCIPLHPKVDSLDYTRAAFAALTKAEWAKNSGVDAWGGRKTVGGSGWNTPSQLLPEEVIDIVLRCV